MSCSNFWKTAKENLEEVKTWSKWMQKIVITAETASTGKFIMSEEEWERRFKLDRTIKKLKQRRKNGYKHNNTLTKIGSNRTKKDDIRGKQKKTKN